MINIFSRKENATIEYLKKEKNLRQIRQVAEQIHSNEKIIQFYYKDDTLFIINEEAALYHIVNTTAKMEKLATASASTQTGGVMLDIGANVGLFSFFYKKRNPQSRIFLFEPDKKLIPVINKNLQQADNFEILNQAIGDKTGEIDFFYNPQSSQTNSTERDALLPFSQPENIVTNKVFCQTLADFCSQKNITEITTLKIDIQGGEFKALSAGKDVFSFTQEVFVEICFLMPDTIPLIKLMDQHYSKYTPVTEIIMGADLKFYK